MHFSIPDTKESLDDNGSTYLAYNIQVNGWHHCSLRYRQLLNLHHLLQRELPTISLPAFPPKKILPLSLLQTEDRRHALEKYILALSQEPRVLLNHHFNGFLACAQHESFTGGGSIQEVPIQVFLMNGQRIVVTATDAFQTQHLLQLVCQQIGLPCELMNYFALYLVKKQDSELTLVKKLQNFECPYISQKSMRGSHRIVLRRNYWVCAGDSAVEDHVLSHPVGLGLVYGQVVAEVQCGWVLATPEQHRALAQLQARGQKKEYLEAARTLRYYGCTLFSPCVCDFPAPNTPVTVAIGNNELNFRISGEDGVVKEGSFKVTRMRCWRISTHQKSPNSVSPCSDIEGCISNDRNGTSKALSGSRQNSTNSNSSGFGSTHSLSSSSGPHNNGSLEPNNTTATDGDRQDFEDLASSSKHSNLSGRLASPLNGCSAMPNLAGSNGQGSSDNGVTEVLQRPDAAGGGAVLELSFEYLLRAGEMRWVRVLSNQAVLMSLCLQSMVQQLIGASAPGSSPTPPACPAVTELPVHYTKTDGSSVLVYTYQVRQPRNSTAGLVALGELSLRRLTEKFAELNGSNNSSSAASQQQPSQQLGSSVVSYQQLSQHVVENSAFNIITDQHL
ncbi:sorting nexin-17 [Hyalella azteca]|uniref:Sorting nexin-17 n=1 Tax=Hyalella azteca TaxID=294128 RepID=A0A8B7NIL4_HYAAZ|nr:sorting nexin-17 [Hyalella azteca]